MTDAATRGLDAKRVEGGDRMLKHAKTAYAVGFKSELGACWPEATPWAF